MLRWLFVVIFLTVAAPANAIDTWTKTDTIGEVAFVSLVAVDAMQTHWFLDHGYEEMNPFYGRHPSDARLFSGMLFGAVFHASVTAVLPAKLRPVWRHVSIAVQTGFIGNNYGVTGGFHLSF